MNVTKFLAPLAFVAFLAAGVAHALDNALSLPEVYKSHSSGKCTKMVTHDGSHLVEKECPETLPARYTLVWVQ